MPRRHPIPRFWLMTDERQGDDFWRALAALPRGAGIVFRHYRTPPGDRRRLFKAVRAVARRRGLVLVLADSAARVLAWGADGRHGRGRARLPMGMIRTAPAHDRMELIAAARTGADLAFLSPVFPTRSHPDASALGLVRFAALAQAAPLPVIALGGMSRARWPAARRAGAAGYAAIDGWLGA